MSRHPMLDMRVVSEERYEVSDLLVERFSDRRIWLWDLEATGLDTTKERVTQIAGILLDHGHFAEETAFTQYVFPGEGVEIPKVVQDLTGITLDMLQDAPSFPEAWRMHLDAAQGADLWMGQSVFEFDVPLLEAEFARHGMRFELPPVLDSVVVATWLLGEPEERWSTTKLLEKFSVDTTGLRRHDALDDVKILGRILIPMLQQIREQRGDVMEIRADEPIGIRRHPPIRDDEADGEGAGGEDAKPAS